MDDKGTKLSLHSISSLFDDTWRMYQERFSTLIEIVLLPVLLMTLGYVLIGIGWPFSIAGGLVLFVGWIVFILSVVALIVSVDGGMGVDASYKKTMEVFWPLGWVLLLQVAAVMGAFWMLILPGIWISVALSLASYVFVIEHRRGIDALRQSKDYIKGYWWALLGRSLLLGVILWVMAFIVQLPVAALFGGASYAAKIISMLVTLFAMPFSVIYSYNLYQNFRELKPELAEARTKKGTGFIKAAAIVGVVMSVVVAAGFALWIHTLLQMHTIR